MNNWFWVEFLQDNGLLDHFLNLKNLLLDNDLSFLGLLDQFLDDQYWFLGLLGDSNSDDDFLQDKFDLSDDLLGLLVVNGDLLFHVFDQFVFDNLQFLVLDLLSVDKDLVLFNDYLNHLLSLLQVHLDLNDQFLGSLLFD